MSIPSRGLSDLDPMDDYINTIIEGLRPSKSWEAVNTPYLLFQSHAWTMRQATIKRYPKQLHPKKRHPQEFASRRNVYL